MGAWDRTPRPGGGCGFGGVHGWQPSVAEAMLTCASFGDFMTPSRSERLSLPHYTLPVLIAILRLLFSGAQKSSTCCSSFSSLRRPEVTLLLRSAQVTHCALGWQLTPHCPVGQCPLTEEDSDLILIATLAGLGGACMACSASAAITAAELSACSVLWPPAPLPA